VDQSTNVLSVFEIVEEVHLQPVVGTVQAVPDGALLDHDLTLIALLARSADVPEQGDVILRLVTPKGEHVMGTMAVDLRNHKRFRLIARMNGIPFFGLGTYWFTLTDSRDKEIVRYDVEILETPHVQGVVAAQAR